MINNLTDLVVDVSKYQRKIRPAEYKAGGVKLTIIKASGGVTPDPKFPQHYEDCAKADADAAVYHWVDPILSPSRQNDVLLKTIKGKKICAIALDLEQWWNNWGTWYDAINKKIAWSLVPRIRPDLIAKHAYNTLDDLLCKASIPVIIYTSYGFVTSYAPKMAEWLGRVDLWPAHWIIKSNVKISCTWETLNSVYKPKNTLPTLPPGADPKKVVGWQYTGDLISLSGMYGDDLGQKPSPADISLFDPNWLSSVTGRHQTEIPPAKPEPVLEKYAVSSWVWRGLNLREQPSSMSKSLAVLRAGTVLIFAGNISGDWVRVVCNDQVGWVHSAYVTKF